MENLDLYKDRTPYSVTLEVKGGKKTFKIPTELTVEESERLLEAEIKISDLMKQEVDQSESDAKLKEYFDNLFAYLQILFSHYQPETTVESLRKIMTQAEAVRVLEFFKRKRFLTLLGLNDTDDGDVKKKSLKQP